MTSDKGVSQPDTQHPPLLRSGTVPSEVNQLYSVRPVSAYPGGTWELLCGSQHGVISVPVPSLAVTFTVPS